MKEHFLKKLFLEFKTNKLALGASLVIILLVLASVFAFIYPVDPNALNATQRLMPPSFSHPFGTDDMGRDYLARSLYGGRVSLLVGFLAMILSTVIGVAVGTISGYFGGIIDNILMRIVDILMSLPTFLIMVVMNAYLKAGVESVIIIIGLLTWMSIARIVRAETISVKEREFVIYSKISGERPLNIILSHIIPIIMPTIIVSATINIASAILMESSLSFFGMGIKPPDASWGSMLNNAQGYITEAPHLAMFPGILIFLTVLSFNFSGDVFRRIFEPITKSEQSN